MKKKEEAVDTRNFRGYAIIGLHAPTKEVNIGHALRAVGALNGKMVVVSKVKYSGTGTDTPKSYRHVPLLEVDELKDVIPYDCTPVAVEMIEGAVPLQEYVHPERAFYIFGQEEGMLDQEIIDYCKDVISIPSSFSLNLGVCVNIILYDRLAKQIINDKTAKNRKAFFASDY